MKGVESSGRVVSERSSAGREPRWAVKNSGQEFRYSIVGVKKLKNLRVDGDKGVKLRLRSCE